MVDYFLSLGKGGFDDLLLLLTEEFFLVNLNGVISMASLSSLE